MGHMAYIMRLSVQLFFLLAPVIAFSQSEQTLRGSWVRILETGHETDIQTRPSIVEEDYLKLSFGENGQMKIYAGYRANGIQIAYQNTGTLLSFGSGRQFKIEQQSKDRFVLLDLVDGEVTSSSRRHYYLRESVFLDKLHYPLEDRVVLGNDTAYLASKKLYPVFQTTNTPDFHIFIHNQIKSSYSIGENYFQATFMIRPDGSIDHININHHIGKASDKRAIKAILASTGRWQMPRLNGHDVNIIMTIEDLFTRRSENSSSKPLKTDLDYSSGAPKVYMGYFNKAIRAMLTNQHQTALEYIQLCEDRKPKDPNLHYLRYLLYTALGENEAADKHMALVKRSRLRYLIK